MALSHKLIIAAVVLLLVSSVSASADWTKTSYLTGTLASGTGLRCDALVTQAGDIYTYTYTLIYTEGASTIHTYKVYNPSPGAYFSATNGDGFTNPADGSASQISWTNGTVFKGTTCVFSYQSYYKPMEIDVWTVAIDSGKSASGKTLGMGAVIPEPSSIVALLFGAVALVPLARRRK